MTSDPVRLGIAGLGRAFMLTVPAFQADSRIRIVAAAAPRADSRAAFEAQFGGRSYASVDELAADVNLDVIYVATPHQMHADHVIAGLRGGKHVIVDKPLSVSMEDADRMVAAAAETGCHLIVGPSHSFDAPVALARSMIDSGEYGRLRMVQAFNYTDFLYRPRRPEELRTEEGGGVLFSQGIHQIDMVRLLCGGRADRVVAMTGNWDPHRPTEGAYSALLSFIGGAFATITYSGYAHFDSDIWMDGIGELGAPKKATDYGKARSALQGLDAHSEAKLKTTRTFGQGALPTAATQHEHFGPVIALCDRADLRLTPSGVEVFGDQERKFFAAPAERGPRREVIDAVYDAVRHGNVPTQTGAWGRASLEVCHAILKSAESGNPVALSRQCGLYGEETKHE
ncbi:Gfo/Idh/MocA family oxidoreductase [Loktanella sp. M215]|uniref:Gfo/Idh/MocA family oxidoreductase n=1 Tax=Loktanella sp. M215 TaxID=2675431 RepID=UPI001F30EC78|nr:Gfo/Idh/MocA family oxidoreductase [Loktanella sp. M215]MCF7702073.1 gfo/Idh/MocA family oxidoreductase [Loktanella sp. M215]